MNTNFRYADDAFLWRWEDSLKKGDAVLARFWDESAKADVEHKGKVIAVYQWVVWVRLEDGRKARCHRCKPGGIWSLKRGVFPLDWEERCRNLQESMGE